MNETTFYVRTNRFGLAFMFAFYIAIAGLVALNNDVSVRPFLAATGLFVSIVGANELFRIRKVVVGGDQISCQGVVRALRAQRNRISGDIVKAAIGREIYNGPKKECLRISSGEWTVVLDVDRIDRISELLSLIGARQEERESALDQT